MLNTKRNLLSVALASAIMLTATGVQAQTAEETAKKKAQPEATNLDAVTVTGIRRGIESAISVKRDSTSIVEAISAEDIGKLPDVSIAESIARLPGLAAQRVAGRAQVISVRGLSPDFATTLLNGREVVSTGDNRSVEFDQYPSELISGVTVYKTPDSGLIGQGLSGTIDMQTVRPLSYNERVIAISGRYQKNSLGEAAGEDPYGSRINASFVDKFADGTVGLAIGYSHMEMSKQENQVGLYEPWQQVGDNWRPGVDAGTWYSDGIKALRRTGSSKRDAVMATLQFRPNSTWNSTLDAFYTKAKEYDTANQMEIHLGDYNGGYGRLEVSDVVVNDNGTIVSGTAKNVYPLVRGMYNNREDSIKALGWNNEFTFGDVRLVADVSWSKAVRDETNLENNLQLLPAPQLDSVKINYAGGNFPQFTPGLDYSDYNKLYLTNTIYGSGYGKTPHVDDELKGFKLAANFPAPDGMTWFSDVDFGINYADRQKDKTQAEGNINLGAQGETTIAADLQYKPVNLGFAGAGYIPAWNVPAAVGRYMLFNPTTTESYLIPKQWTVDEEITTTFLRANISTQIGSVPVRGNVGIQAQHVRQSSNSNYWDGGQPVGSQVIPIKDGKSYIDFLPSLNLAFELPAENTIRFAIARQVARPRVDELRASMEFGVDTNNGTPGASGGNPNLDPWVANAVDLSWEKYFGNRAYVAAAVFYKDLQTYIYTEKRDGYDFTQQVDAWLQANAISLPPGVVVDKTGTYTAPFNGSGGTLRGAELTASLPLDLFFEGLRGFGLVASASFNDSDITIPPDPATISSVGSDPIMLPGLSKRVYNFTAYYENSGFEARLNQRKRSDFIGEIGNFNGNRTLRYVKGENVLDAQISYNFGDGTMFKGLGLFLQASNLTNSKYETYAESKDRPLETVEWGRTYQVGVNYKF
ncbi:TonB-dependent receptor [Stenotrophomonas sp. SY1]|jgi:iron complex outermembrane receptor protein|uniref:TonB-dependent receptor n=1 Tax=Stenotrophomonas sp. SY1 TaxID=477235 RepID=UPI001E5E46E6|nr:TonB-dependent receptor [Stenotrophomonas sp. SY1]MCD9087718.1 TonB-dependent receptor [Stenotrophomonas sp. SY1]